MLLPSYPSSSSPKPYVISVILAIVVVIVVIMANAASTVRATGSSSRITTETNAGASTSILSVFAIQSHCVRR